MNARKQEIDKTFLSLDLARERGFLHRDYLAHCCRWSHVVKRLMEKKTYAHAKILDIGCGRELPLARTLYSSRIIPLEYRGVDYGPIETEIADALTKTGKFPLHICPKTDILKVRTSDDDKFTHGVMFEVAEHMEPKHLTQVLLHLRDHLIVPGGTLWLSTPNWNMRDTANNHVNEMTYHFLGRLFTTTNWRLTKVWGTFASISDYYALLSSEEKKIFDELRAYYDTNVLSIIFAPLVPAASRNCLWELCNACPGDMPLFDPFTEEDTLDSLRREGSTSQEAWKEFLCFLHDNHLIQ